MMPVRFSQTGVESIWQLYDFIPTEPLSPPFQQIIGDFYLLFLMLCSDFISLSLKVIRHNLLSTVNWERENGRRNKLLLAYLSIK